MTNNNHEINKKQSVRNLRVFPGVIIMGVAIILLASILYIVFAYVGFVDPPNFLSEILFGKKQELETSQLLKDLQERIDCSSQSIDYGVSSNIIDWNDVSIEDICDTSYTGSYYQIANVTYSGTVDSNAYSVLVSKENNILKYLVTSGLEKGKSVLNDGNEVIVSYNKYKKSYDLEQYNNNGLYFENEVGCPSIRQLKDKISLISSDQYSIQFEENADRTLFRITFTNSLTDIREVYEVKGGLGIIVRAYFYNKDSSKPFYSFNTTSLMVGIANS